MSALLALLACTSAPVGDGGTRADGPFERARDAGASISPGGVADGAADGESWPVVVVGGGVAGMAVAAELGGGLVLEGSDTLGGRASLSGADLFFVDVPPQDAVGFDDSVALAVADWPALTGADATEATVAYFSALPEVYARLTELGVAFGTPAADAILARPRELLVDGGGPALVAALAADVPPEVEVRTGVWVEGIEVVEGRVAGVRVDGETIAAEHVVIATGGFVGDADWVRVAVGEAMADGEWAPSEGDLAGGDALDWATAGGWATGSLDAVGWLRELIGVAGDDGEPVAWAPDDGVPWIWVDGAGARFCDETRTHSVLLSTPYRAHEPVWGVATAQDFASRIAQADADAVGRAMAEERGIVCRGRAEDLAEALGVDAEGLVATLEAVDGYRAGDAADPLGRPGDQFADYANGALCGYRVGAIALKSFGGVSVDLDGRVLDGAGVAVPGLWAVGEAAGMGVPGMGGASGWDGSLSAVVWSGWRTGAVLTAELQGR